MRLLFKCFLWVIVGVVVVISAAVGDLLFDRSRLISIVLGRDGLVSACRPALIARLKDDGFQPDDVEFDDAPDITFSTVSGRVLSGRFTFTDGALRTRVDGLVACAVTPRGATVDVRTRTTPMRAT